jgi:parvulin-like peptidyl-prolyl isomerase
MTEPSDETLRNRWHFDRPSERRSLFLCAIGAVAGLAVAGAGLFTAQGTRIAGVPPEDVAIVNQVPILMSDFVSQLSAVDGVSLDKATPEKKRKILDQMIREELFVQRGIELGLQNDVIEVRTALVGAVEEQQAVDASATQPTEDVLRTFYNGRVANYANEGRMTLTDFIAPNLTQAIAAVAALRAGQSDAAAAHGLKSSGKVDDGEEFYFAARIHLGSRLYDVARALKDREVSDPIALPDGEHVLVMQRNIPPKPQPFETVRDRVLTDFRNDKIARMQAGADLFLRKRADVQIAKGFE